MDNEYFTEEFLNAMTPEEGKFILDHAEKVLKDTVDTNSLIVTRTTTLITLASTITIALIGFVISRHDLKGKLDKEIMTSLAAIIYLLWVNRDLFKLVLPRAYYSTGAFPRKFFTKEIFDQHKDNRLKVIYATEIQECQKRMVKNSQENESKWKLYETALRRMVYLPGVVIIFYLALWGLFALFSCQGS